MGMGWLNPVGSALNVLGAGTALFGSLFGADEVRRQRQAQEAAANAYQQAGQQQYQGILQGNARSLYSAGGAGSDLLQGLGPELGSSLAGAGVYNSSAVGGALSGAQRNIGSGIAGLSQNLYDTSQGYLNNVNQNAANMRLGIAGQGLQNARADLGEARSGAASAIGSLGQRILQASGVNDNRASMPMMNGTMNMSGAYSNTPTGMSPPPALPQATAAPVAPIGSLGVGGIGMTPKYAPTRSARNTSVPAYAGGR